MALTNPLSRLSAAALALGGITGAAFVIVSRGEIMGALAMLSPRWMVAHNLHFTSAALLLFGVVGLYLAHAPRMHVTGHFAFVLALLGTGFYFATGVITAAVLPFVAGTAPNVVSPGGPLFHPVLPALIVSVGLFHGGWLALGIVTARAAIFPAWTGWMVALGSIIALIPPQPFGRVPWIVTDIGWVIFAIGLIGMGLHGWRNSTATASIGTSPSLASGD